MPRPPNRVSPQSDYVNSTKFLCNKITGHPILESKKVATHLEFLGYSNLLNLFNFLNSRFVIFSLFLVFIYFVLFSISIDICCLQRHKFPSFYRSTPKSGVASSSFHETGLRIIWICCRFCISEIGSLPLLALFALSQVL